MKVKLILLRNTNSNCKNIASRLYDFTEFCVQKRYPIHSQDDIDPITIADEDYIFVIKAGHVFWDASIFDQCIEESNEAVMGNENWFLINCKLLKVDPVEAQLRFEANFYGDWYSESILDSYVSNRPTKTFSNEIETLKAFCYPETYYSEIEQLMENLDYSVPKKIEPFAWEIREAARNLDVGYYVVNTEDVSIENKFDKKFDNYIGVCGGLKTYILLGQDYFTNDTSVLMFDISPAAIEWQKYLREHWDGNADSFIQISQDFKELRPGYIAIQDSYRTLERYLNENNISKHDLQTWWNKFQKLNVEYKQIDLFSSSDVLELAKYTENKNNTYFWLSNCFVMERLVFQYGSSHTLEKEFKDTFRQLSNSPCTYDISVNVG
jgi:hypothetical protein